MVYPYKAVLLILAVGFVLSSCGENTEHINSGTYEGTIESVIPAQTEIYVRTEDDKILELYFTDDTQVIHNGKSAPFDQLKQNQKVRVTVKKVGQRLNPVKVEILE